MKIRGLCRDFGFDIIKEKGVCHEAVDGMDDLGVCGNELGLFSLGLSVADGDGGALRGGHLLVKFGRRARGQMRRVFAAAFLALCAVPVGCAVWCLVVFLKI